MPDTFEGRVRTTAAQAYADGYQRPDLTPRGDWCVAQGLPPKTDVVRQGNTWTCAIATGSAFAPVAAWPTTRAELVLYNGEAGGGKTYVVDSAFITAITSIAAAGSLALLAQLALGGISPPTNDTAQLIFSRSGRGAYNGRASRAVANTAFALANKWEAIAAILSSATTTIGQTAVVELAGGWHIPPGGALCLAGLAGTAAGTAIVGVTWHEVQLPVVA